MYHAALMLCAPAFCNYGAHCIQRVVMRALAVGLCKERPNAEHPHSDLASRARRTQAGSPRLPTATAFETAAPGRPAW
eukprot:7457085-Pyramimonas_sp.AAC.1